MIFFLPRFRIEPTSGLDPLPDWAHFRSSCCKLGCNYLLNNLIFVPNLQLPVIVELTLLMGPITAMHHCLMGQTVVVMLEDVEVRILNVGITQGDLLRGIVNFRVRLDLLSKSVKVLLKSE